MMIESQEKAKIHTRAKGIKQLELRKHADQVTAAWPMLPLRCTVQSYAWGVPASQDCKVLSLARANRVEAALKPDADTRFAELWLGTHPSGGASIASKAGGGATAAADPVPLDTWLEQHPEALGRTLAQLQGVAQPQGQGSLPFLMKVLSIDKALPLQAHPTSSMAKRLHQHNPELYPDAAHKPEMVVALSSFCGFAGFLAYDKMSQLLGRLPQLAAVLGDGNVQRYLEAGPGNDAARQKALASMFQQLLLHTPPEACTQTLDTIMKHLHAQQQGSGAALLPAGTQTASSGHTGSSSSSAAAVTAGVTPGPSAGPSPTSLKVPTTGTSSAEVAAEAKALSGPSQPACQACDLALAFGLMGQPGGMGQRDAMLAAAAQAWPGDAAGVLALMLLEDVVLQRGEAMLIPAGCPHAYVCGEVLEVQAASNNTIKGGLTAPGEPIDKQGLVHAVTGGLLLPPAAAAAAEASGVTGGVTGVTTSGGDQVPEKVFEGPPPLIAPSLTGSSLPHGSVEGLRLYQPPVREFQLWHVGIQAGQKAVELVLDTGPGVLLVTRGSGLGVVRAGVLVDEALVDEAELHPGAAVFIPAGSSLSISGSSTTEALDAWMTTANPRMFTAAPPAGAAATPAAEDVAAGREAGVGSGGGGLVTGDAAERVMGVPVADPGAVFTASEQVAAAVMAGAAGSSCPANAPDAAAAAGAGQGGGGGAVGAVGSDSESVPMDTE